MRKVSKLKAVCLDCGIDTLQINEFYMVRSDIWHKAVPDEDYKMTKYLCIECLEKRLQRKLQASDFQDLPLNWPGFHKMSPLLLSRIKATG